MQAVEPNNQANPQDVFAPGELAASAAAADDTGKAGHIRRIFAVLGVVVVAAVMFKAVFAYRELKWEAVSAMVPHHWSFWTVFVLFYLHGPLLEWVIFRRLWNIPFLSGIMALLRKLVSNELVFGYLGEAQFYSWVRARANLTTAPFGAIKDVAILSALTGNGATVVMLIFAWPIVSSGQLGMAAFDVFLSLGFVLLTSCVILLFRKKLFSLDRRELWFITGAHIVRTILFIVMSATLWHLVLPQVSVGLWTVMATLRMLVSRLPFLPNKDVVFAGLAVFLLGHDLEIAALMTMMAAITLAAHVIAAIVTGIASLVETQRSVVG